MHPVSEQYLRARRGPHQVVVRADVTQAGQTLYRNLPVTAGSISVSSQQIARRSCELTITPRLPMGRYADAPAFPVERAGAPLGTDGQEITVRHGLRYPGGRTEWVPAGVFRIDDVDGSLHSATPVRVHGPSREAWVADDRFPAPRTVSGGSAVGIIRNLLLESFSDTTVVVLAHHDRRVPATVLDEDRWGAIRTLADSIGAVVHTDGWGRFVIADAPTLDDDPVHTFTAGPGGAVLDTRGTRSRRTVYNRLVVTGATPDGATAPVRGMATDTGHRSPTRFGDPSTGAWGRRTRFMAIPSLTTVAQCVTVARAQLATFTGAGTVLDISAVPLAPLEALDVINVVADHTRPAMSVSRHIVDSFTLPLTPGAPFRVQTRDLGAVA